MSKPIKDLTTIPTAMLYETGLSVTARMAVIILSGLPQEGDTIPSLLSAAMGIGINTVYKHLRELEDYGWLRRTRLKDERGKYSGYRYEVLEREITR